MPLLTRKLGIQPTGPDGTWTRMDHLRAAGLHLFVYPVLWGAVILESALRSGKMGVVGLTAALLGLFTTISLLVRLLFAAIGKR